MINKKISLLILFGGTSSEHEVSCMSAASILRHINREKYDLHVIGITKTGKWLLTQASPDKIENGSWERKVGNKETIIYPDRNTHGIRNLKGKETRIDCVFPILHGKDGEDGAMQGLLELSGIPYVGSGVASSACSMDKAITKVIIGQTGIRQAEYYVTNRYDFISNPTEELKNIESLFRNKYPLFVKPANTGSSVGVSKVNTNMELFEAIKIAANIDHKIVIEEEIVGREIEVAVLGNRNPHASPIGEIITSGDFYDYEAKYHSSTSRTEVVNNLQPTKEMEIRDAAITVYKALGCRGLSRADFFLTKDKEVVFNEINTLPGFTNISMYPKLWEVADITYEDLIDRLIELAMEEI